MVEEIFRVFLYVKQTSVGVCCCSDADESWKENGDNCSVLDRSSGNFEDTGLIATAEKPLPIHRDELRDVQSAAIYYNAAARYL